MSSPKILFVPPPFEDYLADGLLHGLRRLYGADVVDYPKAEPLYSNAPQATRDRIRGGGFTLYWLLEDEPIDRSRAFHRAAEGEFDLVVFADIWRTFGLWTEWGPQLAGKVPLAVLDGADRVEPYPYGGFWWRVRPWWFLPRAHRRATYFKREITRWSSWLPGITPISFSIPEEKIVTALPAKEKEFGAHVVDPEVAPRVGGQVSYAFDGEAGYYADLQRSKYGITVKRAGWDALRHYEIALNAAVPCFRDLHTKPPRCAPHGLRHGVNCLDYRDADDLLRQVGGVSDDRYAELQAGALDWARASRTTVRAQQFLAAMDLA